VLRRWARSVVEGWPCVATGLLFTARASPLVRPRGTLSFLMNALAPNRNAGPYPVDDVVPPARAPSRAWDTAEHSLHRNI
jgi:hypothetical protein